MNCETDFAGKGPTFTGLLRDIGNTCLNAGKLISNIDDAKILPYTKTIAGQNVPTVGQAIEQLAGLLRENVQLRRVLSYPESVTESARIFSYVHNMLDTGKPPVGRIGVLLHTEVLGKLTPKQEENLSLFASQMCMQIAGMNARFLDSPPPGHTAPELESEEARDYPDEPSLLKQEFLFDPSLSVAQYIEKFQSSTTNVQVKNFVRWKLGEGMAKVQTDLASEVSKLLKS